MRLVMMLCLTTFLIYAESILVINSNADVARYKSVEDAFSKQMKTSFLRIDISKMSNDDIKEYLYDIYPDIVYAIGTKAYQFSKKYIPEKKIFFSSIVNYKRLDMSKKSFGISNEMNAGMKLTLIKALLNKTKTIGMVYSRYTEDVYESFKEASSMVGIDVIAKKVDKDDTFDIPNIERVDTFVMIADPIVLKDEKMLKRLFKTLKNANKPIVAYHPLYIKYGAVLVLSVDIDTVGRQIASMIYSDMHGHTPTAIQTPIGTEVIFNEGLAKRMKLHYDKSALGIVNKVIK